MILDKKLKFITSIEGVNFYEYRVSLFHYFYTPMAYYEKLFSRCIRETLDYIRGGYHVIYMEKDNYLVGYGTITRGGGRYRFSTSNDIVCCNIWVQPEHRGKGYSSLLYKAMTENLGIKYYKAYAFIRHDNIASIRAAERAGFCLRGNATHRGKLQCVISSEKGHLGIYEKNYS